MKKRSNFLLLIVILVLCLTNTAHLFAQEKEIAKQGAEYGIKAGINFAELWGKDALPESDRKVGYSFGGYASYKISKGLKLQPEVIWSLQGENSKDSGRYKISYVNIPVMLKWKQGKFYYELGPQLGLLTINTAKSVPNELKLENFETFDFTVNAGIGYNLAEDWTIGIRYCQGITNISSGRDLKNSVFYLGLAFRLF
uniref:porin family protein n=1 Tax=Roseivirga sp. TaxID=1964215 RepID=UPI004047F2C1